ncbi:NAD(P)-dependent alcohol dehydrogenase [bacterium]|nr:NAD(P)-dependent alcohol dehydrogenase [bacterium]
MKAVVYDRYGGPEELRVEEVPTPVPKDDEVLLRVHASSVNSWDWDLLCGSPFFIRMWGLTRPKHRILGFDVAGVVEAVGKDVMQFSPGDAAFGDLTDRNWGGFAEYVNVPSKLLHPKPSALSYEQAASLPQAGLLALQGLRQHREMREGEQLLINGAGGGVGTFAVQIAKSLGVEVTVVDSAEKLDMLRQLGADHVIDYRKENFTEREKRYDRVLDVIAQHGLGAYSRVLRPGGVYSMVGGRTSSLISVGLFGWTRRFSGGRFLGVMPHVPNKGLQELTDMVVEGKVTPIIGSRYPLTRLSDAMREIGEGRVIGKIAIDHMHPESP